MNRTSLVCISVAAAITVLVMAAVVDSPRASVASTEVDMDSYRADNSAILTTGPVLASGHQYVITMSGTWSYWSPNYWPSHGTCGITDAMPQYPSPGTVNSVVGTDAVWGFAAPKSNGVCVKTYPHVSNNVQLSLDGGVTFGDPPVTPGSAPAPDHTYHFTVTGQGKTVAFKIDDAKSTDNYGIVKAVIEQSATPSPTSTPSRLQGDLDCNQIVNAVDAFLAVRYRGGVALAAQPPCPRIALDVIGGFPFADVDCSGDVAPPDLLKLLRYLLSLSVSQPDACARINTPLQS